jgi:hypothetical protein
MAETGEYEVLVGASSKDIRQKASFSNARDRRVSTVSVSLVPDENINELKSR